MKFSLILFFALLVVVCAHRRKGHHSGASIGGAKVGVYRRTQVIRKGIIPLVVSHRVPKVPVRRRIRIVRPRLPLHGGGDDQYFASLGGADVGVYKRNQYSRRGFGPFGGYEETEISGVSLGKAKLGGYGRPRG
ncbi:hypothetical protein NPIL_583211 [Nephila pilipes]|uniref:Uncharacterized protein n=1 Tax=Nephila pilipes TaxID=299642 RepID=A0A8X6TXG9_NEPPI|nr:hypothetical protein NPIL_583211 [Nephila pilipes]